MYRRKTKRNPRTDVVTWVAGILHLLLFLVSTSFLPSFTFLKVRNKNEGKKVKEGRKVEEWWQ
jgi:hypothetical protein